MTDYIDRRGTRLSLCGAGSDGRLVIRFDAQERIGYKKSETEELPFFVPDHF